PAPSRSSASTAAPSITRRPWRASSSCPVWSAVGARPGTSGPAMRCSSMGTRGSWSGWRQPDLPPSSLGLVVPRRQALVVLVLLVGSVHRQLLAEERLVHPLAQVLADLEERKLLGRDVHRLAGARVAALVGLVLADGETTKSADFNALSVLECLHHRVEDTVHDLLGFPVGQLELLGDSLDELGLGDRSVHWRVFP